MWLAIPASSIIIAANLQEAKTLPPAPPQNPEEHSSTISKSLKQIHKIWPAPKNESILHVCPEESRWCICCADFSNFYIWDYHRFRVYCSFWKTEFHSVAAPAARPGALWERGGGECINEMRDRRCYLNHLNSTTWGVTRALRCLHDLFSYLSRGKKKKQLNHIHINLGDGIQSETRSRSEIKSAYWVFRSNQNDSGETKQPHTMCVCGGGVRASNPTRPNANRKTTSATKYA